MAKNIVVIPARGGSKRLPGKNARNLRGIPLIAHSILYAFLYKDIVDDVYVSTDDAEIKAIALEFGAKVIDRPAELCTDTTPTLPVLTHAVKTLNDPELENVILLQCTNPLRSRDLLAKVWEIYSDPSRKLKSLFSVTRSYSKLGRIVNDCFVPYNYKIGQRSQDLEPLFWEDGVIYISHVDNLLNNILLDERAYPYVNPDLSVDIDTIEEFDHAEFLFDRYQVSYHADDKEE